MVLGLFCIWGLCCAYACEAASAVLELRKKNNVQEYYRRASQINASQKKLRAAALLAAVRH
jgi:hypothetical protein